MLTEIDFTQQLLLYFEPGKRLYWLYLLSSAVIAAIYLFVHKRQRRVVLSKKLWLHTSALLDYKYFIVSFFIKTVLILPLVFGAHEVSLYVHGVLLDHFGLYQVRALSYTAVLVLYTAAIFVVSDFTRYWLHRLLHTVPFLWEFHKVHHSAKVLTPITFYRIHPVENLLFAFRYALSIGAVTGVFIYFFGAYIAVIEIIGVNLFLFVFSLMGSNLRHSHVKLKYPKIVEKICISPYQHQIHHSTDYSNKNYGGYLAVWDWMFGSLMRSKDAPKIRLGLGRQEFATVAHLLFQPFVKIRSLLWFKR